MLFYLSFFTFLSSFISNPVLSAERINIAFSQRINISFQFYLEEVVQIYKRAGVEPVSIVLPRARVDHMFKVGKVNAIGAKVVEFERENLNAVRIDVPLLENFVFKAFVLREDLERVKKLKTPFVTSEAGCLGCIEYSRLHKIRISAYHTDLKTSLELLSLRRADIVIAPSYIIENIPNSKFVQLDNKVFSSTYYHFISKDKVHLKKKLKDEFLKSKIRGAFNPNKIIKKIN